jgi:hypothetical protein
LTHGVQSSQEQNAEDLTRQEFHVFRGTKQINFLDLDKLAASYNQCQKQAHSKLESMLIIAEKDFLPVAPKIDIDQRRDDLNTCRNRRLYVDGNEQFLGGLIRT